MSTPRKPPVYDIFRASRVSTSVVMQLREIFTGEPVPTADLKPYRCAGHIETSWHSINIRKGSLLFLNDQAAAELLEAGTIVPTHPESLVLNREHDDAKAVRKWEERKKLKASAAG